MITDCELSILSESIGVVLGKPSITNRYDSASNKLARWLRSILARRESELKKPIDEAWCRENGGMTLAGLEGIFTGVWWDLGERTSVEWRAAGGVSICVGGGCLRVPSVVTCGQLRGLLADLKEGGAS